MTRTRLDSADEAIEVLGGTKGMMALTGAKPTAVSWWRRNNRFPAKHRDLVSSALLSAGYTTNGALFGQSIETEAAE
jgi:hypothetical protein